MYRHQYRTDTPTVHYYNVMYCILHTHYYNKLHTINTKGPFSHSWSYLLLCKAKSIHSSYRTWWIGGFSCNFGPGGGEFELGCQIPTLLPPSPLWGVVGLDNDRCIIGASLSEPHINGTAMREFYIIYYILYIMVRPSREIIIYPVIYTDINAKYSIAHSHAWDTGRIYVVLI